MVIHDLKHPTESLINQLKYTLTELQSNMGELSKVLIIVKETERKSNEIRD